MNLPEIEFIPLRSVVCSDRATTLDALMRITPPSGRARETPQSKFGLCY
ncbi:MAG: hypothetical protein ACP5RH_12675 [Leptodesmis sp.]